MADERLPFKAVSFEPSRDEAIRKAFPHFNDGILKVEPGNHVLYPRMWAGAADVYNFPVRSEDVFVVGFPKTGTTWLQEIVWQVNNDCNFELSKLKNSLVRVPSLESSLIPLPADNDLAHFVFTMDDLNKMASPRHFKTHFPMQLLPPALLDTGKVVYMARNPKDTMVSYFHYNKLAKWLDFQGDITEFADFFMRDEIARAPYIEHVIEAWNLRNHPNMHFVFYEDYKADLRGEIEKLAKFLCKSLTNEQIEALMQHVSFENCKKDPSINPLAGVEKSKNVNLDVNFYRKGKVGDWKSHFSPELNSQIDECVKRKLVNTDLVFRSEVARQD